MAGILNLQFKSATRIAYACSHRHLYAGNPKAEETHLPILMAGQHLLPNRVVYFLRQAQPNAGGSQADTTNGKDRYLNGNRPQATDDSAKKKTDKKEADKKKSRTGKKDKKGDSTEV